MLTVQLVYMESVPTVRVTDTELSHPLGIVYELPLEKFKNLATYKLCIAGDKFTTAIFSAIFKE